MRKILLRAGKVPFEYVDQITTLENNLIANNSGNMFFAQSVYKSLYAPDVHIDVNGYTTRPEDAERINAEYDAFVIPLANAFRPGFLKQLELLTKLVRKLRIPCVVVGVGAQTNLDLAILKESPIDDAVRRFASAVLDRSSSIGVRGEITREYLARLGFHDVEVIGCPSMYMNGGEIDVKKRVSAIDENSRLAINFTQRMRPAVCDLFRRTWRKYQNSTYVMQDKSDYELLYWGKAISGVKTGDAFPDKRTHPLLLQGKALLHIDVETWIESMRSFEFSFGTRIHGNVAAVLGGTPGFVVAHDSRTLELAQFFDIPHISAKAVNDRTDAAQLYADASYERLAKKLPIRFENYIRFLQRNGLKPSLGEQYGFPFDERMAKTSFPGPVRPIYVKA